MTDDTAFWNRRRLLRTLGGTAALGALAGCSETTTTDGTDEPTADSTQTSDSGSATTTDAGTETGDNGDTGGQPTYGACTLSQSGLSGDCDSPIELTESIESDTVLGDECSSYLVTEDISVTGGANLTIQPGTTLTFDQGTTLEVRDDSSLTAQGTCTDPILMTGAQSTRGYWDGLIFRGTDNLDNRLRHVTVEYGGGKKAYFNVRKGGIQLLDARASFERCTVRENAGEGIYLRHDATLDAFEHCLVTSNETAAGAGSPCVHCLSGTSSYTGNDEDRVLVETGSDLEADADVTWSITDVRYTVDDLLTNYGHLTIEPGATVSFMQGAGINSTNEGTLTAVGIVPETEEVRPITFTGEQKTRGFWRGLQFKNTDRTENQLRNTVVEYGGSQAYYFNVEPANVTVREGSRLRVDNSTIRESDAYGVVFGNEESIDSFTQNTITRNADGAAWVYSPSAHFFSDTSTYVGNDEDKIVVKAEGIAESMDVTWEGLDARYVVTDILSIDGDLQIEPGATVAFESDAGMGVNETGSLNAVGLTHDEESKPITFTGEQKTQGFWRGLDFDNTDRVENVLQQVVVEYGGSQAYYFNVEPANVTARDGARLRLVDATLKESAGFGLYTKDANVTTTNVSFTNNARGPQGQA
ncbi:MAG: hypothetical protein ABEI77_03335 [Halorientalis sp.]